MHDAEPATPAFAHRTPTRGALRRTGRRTFAVARATLRRRRTVTRGAAMDVDDKYSRRAPPALFASLMKKDSLRALGRVCPTDRGSAAACPCRYQVSTVGRHRGKHDAAANGRRDRMPPKRQAVSCSRLLGSDKNQDALGDLARCQPCSHATKHPTRSGGAAVPAQRVRPKRPARREPGSRARSSRRPNPRTTPSPRRRPSHTEPSRQRRCAERDSAPCRCNAPPVPPQNGDSWRRDARRTQARRLRRSCPLCFSDEEEFSSRFRPSLPNGSRLSCGRPCCNQVSTGGRPGVNHQTGGRRPPNPARRPSRRPSAAAACWAAPEGRSRPTQPARAAKNR